jgi:hypothetical protein
VGRGCYGCFGPRGQANVDALVDRLGATGLSRDEVGRLFAGFTIMAEPFRRHVPAAGPARPPVAPPGAADAPD